MTEKKQRRLGADIWLAVSVAAPIAGAAAASHLYTLARDAAPGKPAPNTAPLQFWQTEQFWLNLAATVCLVIALVVGILAKVLDSRKKSKLEVAIEEQTATITAADSVKEKAVAAAKLDQLVRVHDELIPVASSIADMARYPLSDRGLYLKAVAQAAASALEKLVSEHVQRPRAVVYWLDVDAGPVSMKPLGFKGRGRRPQPFEAGTTRGDAAIEFAFEGKPGTIWPDLTSTKPPGFVGSASDYKTFVSMPISTESGAYGMVSLDAPEPNSLTAGDQSIAAIIAEVMSIAFEVGQDQNTPDPGDDEPDQDDFALASGD